jgi:hypothetical protein
MADRPRSLATEVGVGELLIRGPAKKGVACGP